MCSFSWRCAWHAIFRSCCCCLAILPFAAVGAEPENSPMPSAPALSTFTEDEARSRAKLMHEIYSTTLDVVHERYFHGEKAIIPARAMEDIFSEMKTRSNIEARWISVNLRPMSVSHEPKTDFEKRAAEELASGKAVYEAVDDNFYRRAGVIPLGGSCIGCHAGHFKDPPKTPKFAGLVISVPLNKESGK